MDSSAFNGYGAGLVVVLIVILIFVALIAFGLGALIF